MREGFDDWESWECRRRAGSFIVENWRRLRAAVWGSPGRVNKPSEHLPTSVPECGEVMSSWLTPGCCLFLPVKRSSRCFCNAICVHRVRCERVLSGLFLPWLLWNLVFTLKPEGYFQKGPLQPLPGEGETQPHWQGHRPPCGLAPAHLSSLASASWQDRVRLFPGLGPLPLASRCLTCSSWGFVLVWRSSFPGSQLQPHLLTETPRCRCESQGRLSLLFSAPSLSPL